MLRTVKNFIEKQKLLQPGARIIIGLSGGSDSVVLLAVLHSLGYECLAAHCNFHLRGEESDRDERMAAQVAASFRIPFYKQDFDTSSIAKERKISIEMAARDLRYAWFEDRRKELKADAIAVAHHSDDNIETLLLNLIRGTGIAGLTGIKPQSGFVVRPLLCISKEEILQYAASEKLPFVVDSSNEQDEFTRNKIRHQALPLLQSINPGIEASLLRTMEHLNEVEKIYLSHIKEAKKNVFDPVAHTISIPALLAYPSPESILFEILKEYNFGKEVIQSIFQSLDSQSGKVFYSPGYQLLKDREHFFLLSLQQKEPNLVFYVKEDEREITVPFPLSVTVSEEKPEIIKDKNSAYFDFDKLKFPLTLRKWQPGDRFIPFGMKGYQKLSDYFNNNKFSKLDKENTWILCSGTDIIWIVGHRTDNRFKINDDSKKYYLLKLYEKYL
jgi:tRNA(Ile)-lysidine synthase